MAWWTRALPLALLAACGSDPEVELMLEVGIAAGDAVAFVCADGTMVTGTAAQSDDMRQCLGLGCGGRYVAGSADCQDPTKNPAAGTCVETYFACVAPSGACSGEVATGWQYANGSRGAPAGESSDLAISGPSGGAVCVLRAKSGFGSPEEHTYVRPL